MKAEIVPEMQKFRDMLDERGIPWIDVSDDESKGDYLTCRTHLAFGEKGWNWSIINGYGTYGGWNRIHPENIGLLEAWDFVHELIGFLTAEQAFNLITTGSTCGADMRGRKDAAD